MKFVKHRPKWQNNTHHLLLKTNDQHTNQKIILTLVSFAQFLTNSEASKHTPIIWIYLSRILSIDLYSASCRITIQRHSQKGNSRKKGKPLKDERLMER